MSLTEGGQGMEVPVMEEKKRLSEEEFVIQAIRRLRKDPFRGIHSVYSGFNEAYRKYFGTNPVDTTNRLAAEGKIEAAAI